MSIVDRVIGRGRRDIPDDGRMSLLLKRHKNSPEEFAAAFFEMTKAEFEIIPWKAAEITWRTTRVTRDRFRKANFTVEEFLAEPNQTIRRLILLSRSFPLAEVLNHLTEVATDDEATIYSLTVGFRGAQHFLHVKCATTAEDYLLGIPNRMGCPECRKEWCSVFAHRGLEPSLQWTPSAARRWTLGLPEDAVFLQEA
jgi:hypothetical protein